MDMKSSCMFLFVLVLCFPLLLIIDSEATHIIKSLPGYSGALPFKLETGYIGVGKNDQVQLFYYFMESNRDPSSDPLVLWLTGGPGCSGFSAIVYEIGPMTFSDFSIPNARFPSLVPNPYSWTKVANIIFIDSPVGTGYSYATTADGYSSSDTKATEDNYTFLRKWLLNHPKFINHRLYIAGDSYCGITIPMLVLEITKGNENGIYPQMALQGYIIGNGYTGKNDGNERVPYAHRMALISDEYFELAKSSCHGNYVNPDPSNHMCLHALRLFEKCTDLVNDAYILEDKCKPEKARKSRLSYMLFENTPVDSLFLAKEEGTICRFEIYETSYKWANNKLVQEALHIRKDTVPEWIRCNRSLSYEIDVKSVYEYHQVISNKGYRVLAYSGDHDMTIPFTSTLKWIRHLNLSIDEAWRPWIVDDQVAGYTETYKTNHSHITFATVKGAGHTAPEYKPKECFAMFSRWLSLNPL